MWTFRSKEDDVAKISISVFVTNFLDSISSKDLFNACKQYGHVVDSFIATKRSKAGKRFGFVRFINVFSVDRLVNNLCTVWINRHKLHANVARFSRVSEKNPNKTFVSSKPVGASSYAATLKGNYNSHPLVDPMPAIVLEESCLVSRDFDNFVMGEIKDFSAINNLRVLLANEGFLNVKLAYIGGLWVMIELDSTSTKEKFMQHVGVASWFARLCNAQEDFVSRERIVWVDIEGVPLRAWSQSTFKKIGAKWGEVMKLEENKEDMFARKRICIKTSREDNILERFKITVRGKIYMIRAKELFMWSPIFKEPANTGYNSDKDADVGDHEINDNGNDYRNLEEESDIEAVSDTVFGDSIDNNTGEQEHSNLSATKEGSYDPFNIYDLLNKQQVEDNKSDNSISHPPGFTPVNVEDSKHRDRQEGSASSKSRTSEFCSRVVEEAQAVDDNPSPVPNAINKRSKTGGSILDLLDELIKVGNTMGYSLDGCAKDLENIIGLQGECDVPI
ncbi:RNA-directed DNA polymerase, eukaryota [Tanacetum coccineum]